MHLYLKCHLKIGRLVKAILGLYVDAYRVIHHRVELWGGRIFVSTSAWERVTQIGENNLMIICQFILICHHQDAASSASNILWDKSTNV